MSTLFTAFALVIFFKAGSSGGAVEVAMPDMAACGTAMDVARKNSDVATAMCLPREAAAGLSPYVQVIFFKAGSSGGAVAVAMPDKGGCDAAMEIARKDRSVSTAMCLPRDATQRAAR